MTEKEMIESISEDVREASDGNVLYLKGLSDVAIFFGLLGEGRPIGILNEGYRHQDVLVRPLITGGGKSVVQRRLKLAESITSLKGKVFGIVDGDGEPLDKLKTKYDAPFAGPLFTWKAYCIENLLVKTGWPKAWGASPDWSFEFGQYSPYVALNRWKRELYDSLEKLELGQLQKPQGKKLHSPESMIAAIKKNKHFIEGRIIETEFQKHLVDFREALARSLNDAHALLNGKWLINNFAHFRTGRKPDQVLDEWIEHAKAEGGLPEVRELWARIIPKKS